MLARLELNDASPFAHVSDAEPYGRTDWRMREFSRREAAEKVETTALHAGGCERSRVFHEYVRSRHRFRSYVEA
jgi:hypothetical protein